MELSRSGLRGDSLHALPAPSFTQFEILAAGGGFHVQSEQHAASGFGLQSEHVHARIEQRVAEAARRAEAFVDPTRLMLLSVSAGYLPTPVTVGDLAR